jgi:hypothetical protein
MQSKLCHTLLRREELLYDLQAVVDGFKVNLLSQHIFACALSRLRKGILAWMGRVEVTRERWAS